MGVADQAWITAAVDDTTALKAVVLARSLKRALTTRKIAVVVCQAVTPKLRQLLKSEFDQLLKMDGTCEMNGLPLKLHVKIFCWSLPFINRAVFLDPETMVVRNCDELFDLTGTIARIDKKGQVDTAVLVLQPNSEVFENLLQAIKSKKIHSGEMIAAEGEFGGWLLSKGQLAGDLAEKYNLPVGGHHGLLAPNEDGISIVRFVDFHPAQTLLKANGNPNTKESGILEQALVEFWREVYYQDVHEKLCHENQEPLTHGFTKPKFASIPSVDPPEDFSGVEDPIAIVGMSCRFPGANNVEEYWDLLINGRDCIQKVPDHRWPSETTEEFREISAGFLKCPVDEFDGKFFGISPADLINTDPQQRLLMEVVWEALEDAGINPQTLKGTTTGVFVGSWTMDYRDLINSISTKGVDSELSEFHRLYLGNSLGGTGGRLSYLLGLTGPNVATESGCSSGMVGIYLACESLRAGRCRVALTGGVNLLLHPFKRKHMQSIIASDGRCKTFDESADGFGRGEGVASLVLKKYSEAIKDGDRVLALIRGTGISQEGTSRSFGTPTKECQELAMKSAIDNAGLNPTDVCYVEAHGTGTMVGDPVEMAAITAVYSKGREIPLIVTSGKTNIGHTESCSGFAGIIKVILSMRNNTIAPHINLETINPYIKLDAIPAIIPRESMAWEKVEGKPRIAGVSSFGITGTDAHIILQEPPTYTPPKLALELERPLHAITFSAKSDSALDEVLQTYQEYFTSNVEKLNLADVAYTANTGRAHFAYRVALVGKDFAEISKKLKSSISGPKKHIPEKKPAICFLFTGQGSQYEGMARSLYETCPAFKMNFDKCEKILRETLNISLLPVLWPEMEVKDSKLKRSLYSQTSIFCVEYSLMKLWESWGIIPDYVLGHSLGEFAAACSAGILTLEDAIKLVAERSRLIEGVNPGQMVVIKSDKAQVDSLLSEFLPANPKLWLDFAAVNSADQTVLAGSVEAVEKFVEFCATKNIKTHILEATNAFHSRDMEPILPEYKAIASKVTFSKANCVYVSGMTGKILEDGEMNADYWVKHTREKVNFLEASQQVFKEGVRVFLEIGPQPVLSALTMGNGSDLGEEIQLLPSLRRKESEWTTLLSSVSKLYVNGFPIDWTRFDQYYARKKVTLPFYPFHRKVYWYDQGKTGVTGGISFNASSLHPLLGYSIPNATSTKIYQNGLLLEKLPYLRDHAIGEKIIFPGAGYLEMCLAAGNASTSIQVENEKVHMSANPVCIENLTIEAPLGLEENAMCQMQTVVSSEDSSETKISIFTQRSGKWIRQAVGTFTPLPMTYEPEVAEVTKESLESIKARCFKEEVQIGDFYDKLATVGLQFGPAFRSLKQIWKGGDKEMLAEIDIPESAKDYICHPVVLDALIQSIMVGMKRTVDTLYVPIVIGKVVCFAQRSEGATKFYAHSHWTSDSPDSRMSVLYDDTGKVLAFMTGAQMIETSVVQILKALDNQKLSLPNMYEEAWRPKTGPWKSRTNMETLATAEVFSEEICKELAHFNLLSEQGKRDRDLRNELVYMFALRAFYDMGWKPPTSKVITLADFISTFNILKSHERLVTRLLVICTEEGIFTREDTTTWKVSKAIPEESIVHQRLREIHAEFAKKPNGIPEDVKVMSACGEQLSKILQGKASALPILFPEDKSCDTSAEAFYTNTPLLTGGGNDLLRSVLDKTFSHHANAPEEDRGIVRILEVGAGTGSSTKTFLSILEKYNVKYQYTYTDISPAFFIRARELFDVYGKKVQYKVLNIESDPKGQGFAPGQYDYIMASNVLHATKDLKEAVTNVRHLLRDDGLLILVETFAPFRDIDIVFGVLEGFWRYNDLELRPEHPMLSWDNWKAVLKACSFKRLNCYPSFEDFTGGILAQASPTLPLYKTPEEADKTWLVFGEKATYDQYLKTNFMQSGRKVIVVQKSMEFSDADKCNFKLRTDVKEDMEALFKYIQTEELNVEGILYLWGYENAEEDPLKVSHGFMFLAQCLLADFKGLPKLIVATDGIMPIGDQTAVNIAPGTLWGMARSFRSEHSGMFVRCIDLDPDEPNLSLKYKELFTEMWNDDIDYQVAYRQRSRHVCRFITNKDLTTPLTLPNSERFSLVLPATKNIADLKFTATGKPQLKENQVEIAIKVTGLNFRDIFVVLKPDKAFDRFNVVGLEYSGVISRLGPDVTKFKVGDCVIGCHFDGDALPNHVVADIRALIPMPPNLTFHEAATLPAAFATAFYCLVTEANLSKGETVLIHAGSGGVGLMAIQVAQALGAHIIATAGSRRKRAYIRSLGVKHVFHSRNTDYGEQIKEVTKGAGLDVVLNSLTSPGFKEASLGVCNQGARFIEMSKLAVWTTEEVAKLRPDVKYTIVDLTVVVPDTWDVLWKGLSEFYDKGELHPIPYVRFDAVSIREALIYMQKAKHIGKILVTMPEMDLKDTADSEPKTLMFNDRSTYLITGGLGGIGLEVAKWMTESGAKHIILASRRTPNEKAAKIINDLIAKGKNIIIRSVDVGNYAECKELVEHINSKDSGLPPLRGIMHAAGTLADATYPNQTVETFRTAYCGKVQGAWNLHQLTLDCRLEHFMLFSSIVAIFGPLGLSNYASANTFLDALAHYRNSIGLCAQSINWGQWAEVGAAANINIVALRAFTPSQGIAALEVIMKSHKTQSCVLEVDFSSVRKLTGHAGAYLEELKISKDSQQVAFNIKIERFWDEYHSAPEDSKRDVVKCYIEIILRQILKFDDDEPIDENQNFSEMGMDSLMMLEMKNFVQTMLGKNVTMNVSVMAELTTVEKLVNHLMELIVKMESDEEHPLGPADYETFSDEMINLINKDMVLPEHIKPIHGEACKRSEVKNVLFTGVTGKFGPYMLQAILNHPVEKVYCLIRSKVNCNNKDRLRQVLNETKLMDSIDMSRVEVINGDVSEKMFGLYKPEYDALTDGIDSIVHCAVKGNLMDPYTRLGDKAQAVMGGSDIRTPNVLGTLNILEFAVVGKTKSIFHASTLLCNNKVNLEDNTMCEDWYEPEEVFQLKNVGYPISKFICEVLMHQALDRGIPLQVLRFPALFGDSRTGRFAFPNNHAVIRLLGFCKLGALPAIPLPIQVLPSDLAATLACNVFFRDDTPLGVYNLSNPHLNYFHDFAKVSGEHGFPIEVVEYDIFAKKLQENDEYRALFPYGEVDMEEGRYVDFSTSPVAIQAWLKNPNGFFPSKRLLSIYPDLFDIIEPPVTTVRRDLQYAIDSGIADKFGLKRVVS